MKNTVLEKFIERKIDMAASDFSTRFVTIKDYCDEYDKWVDFVKDKDNFKQPVKDWIFDYCQNQKSDLIKLYHMNKFMFLTSKKIFKLLRLKRKLLPQKVYDV